MHPVLGLVGGGTHTCAQASAQTDAPLHMLRYTNTQKWLCRSFNSIFLQVMGAFLFVFVLRHPHITHHLSSIEWSVLSSLSSTAASPAPFTNVFCLSAQTSLTHPPAGLPQNKDMGSGPCHLWGLGGGGLCVRLTCNTSTIMALHFANPLPCSCLLYSNLFRSTGR